jgi:hypothetical protein
MQINGCDHALKVTSDGKGLVGHAGAIPLRKAADQAGLTAQFSAALRKKGATPLLDPGIVLVSIARHERHRAARAPGPSTRGRPERPDGPPCPGAGRYPGQ